MKKITNFLFPVLLGFMIYNFFIKNTAEADATQSYQQVLEGKAVIIDVREQDEVKDDMIKGALWFPLSKMEENRTSVIRTIKEMAQGKNIYVYCRSGNRSGRVKGHLKEANIASINLGGYSALVNDKLPTQPGPQ